MRAALALFALPIAVPATAQSAPTPALFGHLAYAEAAETTLVPAPPGFALGQRCLVQPAMISDLSRMVAAAATAGISLRGLSCYRSYAHQHIAFCRQRCGDAQLRARLVGPPGYSEHATGYAIDFGQRPARACADVSPCFASTDAGRWLLANGPAFGFELSFPQGNRQGVAWEPWHWRWIGTPASEAGSGVARAGFARARLAYPADPAVPPLLSRIAEQPPIPPAPPR